jgi:hypothetical protein
MLSANVCDEGQNPVGGVLYLQRLVGIRMFSLLFSKPTQTDASSRHHFPICRPRHSDDSFPCSPSARSGLPRDHARQWRRAFDPYLFYSNVSDEGQSPVRGDLYLQTPCWNPNVFSSLLQNQSKPTLRAATIFRSCRPRPCATNAVPDSLSGRLAARSRAAVAASIRPISIPFQRQRCGASTRRGRRTHNCLVR